MTLKLIRSLQWAHAAEIAACWAYIGHSGSLVRQAYPTLNRDLANQARDVLTIANDEFSHIKNLEWMLSLVGAKSDRTWDSLGRIVGKTVGFLCYWTGWTAPMKVAELMEVSGAKGYFDLSDLALEEEYLGLAMALADMGAVEHAHKMYFKEIRKDATKRYTLELT